MPQPRLRLISLEFFRHQLARVDAFPQLALLGAISGLLTGSVILVFRASIEIPLQLHFGNPENFEAAALFERFSLPIFGALLLTALLFGRAPERCRVGVVHVMERLAHHQGHLPLGNAVIQFLGGIIALLSGHSLGREGPAIHLGAAAASLVGQTLALPNNSIRTLVACGSAAAIAASFNTPMAGVIFAMEVVMMEYAMSSFIPVILSAVSATILSRAVYGDAPAFTVPQGLALESLWEYPFVVVEGLIVGGLATLFVLIVTRTARDVTWPLGWRLLCAGLLTGCAALLVPEVMGIGYDTVNAALLGELGIATLGIVCVAKLLVSATGAGLGVPAGIIGPSLVIGGLAGGVIGSAGELLAPGSASPVGAYVTLGMAAMMGAVLQAPLAALVAVLELTANPAIILPAMLAIVVATITQRLLGQGSLFLAILDQLGLGYATDPITQHLQRIGVMSVMNRNFVRVSTRIDMQEARAVLARGPDWLVIEDDDGPRAVLSANDLARHIEHASDQEDGKEIDLLAIAGMRLDVTSIHAQATLLEALDTLDDSGKEALCVRRTTAPMIQPIVGILTRKDIELTLQFGRR